MYVLVTCQTGLHNSVTCTLNSKCYACTPEHSFPSTNEVILHSVPNWNVVKKCSSSSSSS